jgi:DNA repair exonuclease SbcCD ATPase subunit
MSELQGFRQALERLDQIVADMAVTDSGLQERSSEIKRDRAALTKLIEDLRGELRRLNSARDQESKDAASKMVAEGTRQVRDSLNELKASADEINERLRSNTLMWGLRYFAGGMGVCTVLLLGWLYFYDPVSSHLRKLEEKMIAQERIMALAPYVQPDAKGGWTVRIQKGSIFVEPDGQVYARLPGK